MPTATDPKTLRKVRDMIRERYTNPEIVAVCGVSSTTVSRQVLLIAQFEGRVDRSDNKRTARVEKMSHLGRAHGGRDHDPVMLDLVDLFKTDRTASQRRRFYSGD